MHEQINFFYTVAFKTLGCKLNQADTAWMVQDFLDHGYEVVESNKGADVSIINTCTVTSRSDAKCRQVIRQVLNANPETTVIVTGCYSQVAGDEIVRIKGVDYVLGTQEKLHIFDIFPGPGKMRDPIVSISADLYKRKIIYHGTGRYRKTRAVLKIQNGCDNRCTYCIVPRARGSSQSVPMKSVLYQAKQLVEQGFKEIILTGVHVGEYGNERSYQKGLPELLDGLGQINDLARIRLTSLEPENVTDALIDVILENEKICRHFHLSIQSGSADILMRMKRKSDLAVIEGALHRILHAFPSVGLGTDIIVGFPGETDRQFNETREFLVRTPFSYFHIFPFSKRPGTPAADFPDQISTHIRMERAKNLRLLGFEKARIFRQQWMGRYVEVLLENRNHQGWMSGWTSEYLRVKVPYQSEWMNQIITVKVSRITDDGVQGQVISP